MMTTPHSEIVERLRNKNWLWTVPGALREEAADEIERLRSALEKIGRQWPCSTTHTMSRVAREALGETE